MSPLSLINSSSQEVTKGVTLVRDTGGAFANVTDKITSLSEAIGGIARSAEMQAEKLGEINASVTDMDRMTQQNAAMAEECTAAARS